MDQRYQVLDLNKPTKDHIKLNCHISAISHYILDTNHVLLYNAAMPAKALPIMATPTIYYGDVELEIGADELV